MRRRTTSPKLTAEEIKDATARFYEVMCLNTVASIREFLASAGVRMGSEDESMLRDVAFREGRALTLYQMLRLMTLFKRRHLAGASSDTTEAFAALAVEGSIPREVFRSTLQCFDLRVPFQLELSRPSTSAAAGLNPHDDSNAESPTTTGANGGIDLNQFCQLLAGGDDGSTDSRLKKRGSAAAINKNFVRLDAVQRGEGLSQSIATDSNNHSGAVSPKLTSDGPKPLDVILHHVRQSLEADSPSDVLFQRKSGHGSERSPVRSEVFPFRQSKKKWDFHDVVERIEEVERRKDVRRPTVSRNVRYCSTDDRPPLALLTPFTDLTKSAGHGGAHRHHPVPARLSRLPPRGLPADLMDAKGQPTRAASVPLSEHFPVMTQRRERLMQALPHRDFTTNGTVGWEITREQRRLAQERGQWAAHQAMSNSLAKQGQDGALQHMAAATIGLIRNP